MCSDDDQRNFSPPRTCSWSWAPWSTCSRGRPCWWCFTGAGVTLLSLETEFIFLKPLSFIFFNLSELFEFELVETKLSKVRKFVGDSCFTSSLPPLVRHGRSRAGYRLGSRCERLHPETGLLAGRGLVMLVRELRGGGGDGDPRECWDVPQDPLTKLGKEQHSLWPSRIL